MARGRRRLGAVAVAALALAVFAPATWAADPPPGVAFHATVAVTVREAGSSDLIAGATVRLVAAVTDFPGDELQSLTGTTDAHGLVTFTGVARAEPGAPPVHLAAMAHRETTTVDPAGCRTTLSWDGLVPEVESADGLAIVVDATPTSSITCSPRPVVRGIVLDPAGHPIRVRLARASIVLPSGHSRAVAIHVAANGRFKLVLPAWGPAGAAATVTVRIVGRVTRHVALANGCIRDIGPVGRGTTVILAEGALPRIRVATREAVLGERCGIVGTPRPAAGGGGAGQSLPPTDVASLGPRADRGPSVAWPIVALGVVAFGAAFVRPLRGRAARVSRQRS